MLVLSRKRNEQIRVPDLDLTITVLEIRGNTVRLGIMAPEDVAVYREELWRPLRSAAADAPGPE